MRETGGPEAPPSRSSAVGDPYSFCSSSPRPDPPAGAVPTATPDARPALPVGVLDQIPVQAGGALVLASRSLDTERADHQLGLALPLGAFPVTVDIGCDLQGRVPEVARKPRDLSP